VSAWIASLNEAQQCSQIAGTQPQLAPTCRSTGSPQDSRAKWHASAGEAAHTLADSWYCLHTGELLASAAAVSVAATCCRSVRHAL